jgi:RNA polymerase sigma-70 factor (ECF subfamily)
MATAPTTRRATDRHILDILYRRYYRRFKARLQRRLHDPQQAEDLVQEAFTLAGECGALGDKRWLRAYLNRIVRNLRYGVERAARTEREILTVSSALAEQNSERLVTQLPGMTEAELELELTRIITRLRGRRGQVFRLSFEGYSYREIALRLGISEAAVGQDLMHARQEIEELLNSCGGAAHVEKH